MPERRTRALVVDDDPDADEVLAASTGADALRPDHLLRVMAAALDAPRPDAPRLGL
jgi:hypothetical protein